MKRHFRIPQILLSIWAQLGFFWHPYRQCNGTHVSSQKFNGFLRLDAGSWWNTISLWLSARFCHKTDANPNHKSRSKIITFTELSTPSHTSNQKNCFVRNSCVKKLENHDDKRYVINWIGLWNIHVVEHYFINRIISLHSEINLMQINQDLFALFTLDCSHLTNTK